MNTVITKTKLGEIEISIHDSALFIAVGHEGDADYKDAFIETDNMSPELQAKIEKAIECLNELAAEALTA